MANENNTLGILGQKKLNAALENKKLEQLEQIQDLAQEEQQDELLNKPQSSNTLQRMKLEWGFNNKQQWDKEKLGIQKYYADKDAIDRANIQSSYELNNPQRNGFVAPNISLHEQAVLGNDTSYEKLLQNELQRKQQLDSALQHNQNQYDKMIAMMNVDKEQFYQKLRIADEEYERNLRAAEIATAPYQRQLQEFSQWLSAKDGRFDTSYWAALQDGVANFLDSATDVPRSIYHFLTNGNL